MSQSVLITSSAALLGKACVSHLTGRAMKTKRTHPARVALKRFCKCTDAGRPQPAHPWLRTVRDLDTRVGTLDVAVPKLLRRLTNIDGSAFSPPRRPRGSVRHGNETTPCWPSWRYSADCF